MKFRKVFRGYDPRQVDQFLKTKEESDAMVLQAQRERIDQLADENNRLKEQLAKFNDKEKAISDALVQSQQLAVKLQNDADKYAEVVLTRAKLFYAAWQAYSQTMVSALSYQELQRFNELKAKLERLIKNYDGSDIGSETADLVLTANGEVQSQQMATATANQRSADRLPTEGRVGGTNPIHRVEQAVGATIDLKELIHPDQSLSDICADLGLTEGKGLTLEIPKGED